MSGYDNLNLRLQYRGGDAEGRMIKGKADTLRKTLHNSYQAETAILEDGREFKCLINRDKLHVDYDNKILSIPFQDRCLNPEVSNYEQTGEGYEDIGIKTGDTFTWKETNTHWLVFLRYLEENSYFRADIRKCETSLDINNHKYWVFTVGSKEGLITWQKTSGIVFNKMNYTLVMFITKNEDTLKFFKRFQKVKIKNPDTNELLTWEVQGHNDSYGDGIIAVFLKEDYTNPLEDKMIPIEPEPIPSPEIPQIEGPATAHKYDTCQYFLKNISNTKNEWYIITGSEQKHLATNKNTVSIDIKKSKGSFILRCVVDQKNIDKQILIKPM